MTDIIFCLVFLPMMIWFFPVERWWGIYPVYFTFFLIWLYAAYFIHRYLVVPFLFGPTRNRIIALVIMGGCIIVTILLASYNLTSPNYLFRQQIPAPFQPPKWGIRPNSQAVWVHYIIVVFFSFSNGMMQTVYRLRTIKREIELERNKAELNLLKAQIHPHFLFNTLNTIYGLLLLHSDKAQKAMERFIGIVKYTYIYATHDAIALKDEVEYIQQYLELQKLRLTKQADVVFDCQIKSEDTTVPPMIFINFVENAFKYGISSVSPCFIHIHLKENNGEINFCVENSIHRPTTDKLSTGLGIESCRKRLELLYPNQYQLNCKNDKDVFIVKLKLKRTLP